MILVASRVFPRIASALGQTIVEGKVRNEFVNGLCGSLTRRSCDSRLPAVGWNSSKPYRNKYEVKEGYQDELDGEVSRVLAFCNDIAENAVTIVISVFCVQDTSQKWIDQPNLKPE